MGSFPVPGVGCPIVHSGRVHSDFTLPTGRGATIGRAREPSDRGPTPRPPWAAAAPAVVPLLAGLAGAALGAAWALRRVEVVGASMTPTLVAGDRLLAVRVPAWLPLRPGVLVAVPDPRSAGRAADRMLVKRVSACREGVVEVQGDNRPSSTDSRTFGPLERRAVAGLVVYRYAPPGRRGPLGLTRHYLGLRSHGGRGSGRTAQRAGQIHP